MTPPQAVTFEQVQERIMERIPRRKRSHPCHYGSGSHRDPSTARQGPKRVRGKRHLKHFDFNDNERHCSLRLRQANAGVLGLLLVVSGQTLLLPQSCSQTCFESRLKIRFSPERIRAFLEMWTWWGHMGSSGASGTMILVMKDSNVYMFQSYFHFMRIIFFTNFRSYLIFMKFYGSFHG